jgi:hypothetical protein
MKNQHISARKIKAWWKEDKKDHKSGTDVDLFIDFSSDRIVLGTFQKDGGTLKGLLAYEYNDESLLKMLNLIRSKGIDTPPLEAFLADTNEQPEAEPEPEKNFWKNVGLVCGGIATGLLAYRLIN